MPTDVKKTVRNNPQPPKYLKKTSGVFRFLGVLNFDLFYSLSLLIIFSSSATVNFTLLALLNLFFALPVAVILNPILAVLAYNEAKQKNWRTHPTIRFALEAFYTFTITNLAFAIYLSFFLPTPVLIPLILAVNYPLVILALTAKAIYNIAAGVYYFNKVGSDLEHQAVASSKGWANLLNGTGYLLIVASMIALYFFPLVIPISVLAVGVAGCALTFFGGTGLLKVNLRNKSATAEVAAVESDQVLNSSKLQRGLGVVPDASRSADLDPNPVHVASVLSPKAQRESNEDLVVDTTHTVSRPLITS